MRIKAASLVICLLLPAFGLYAQDKPHADQLYEQGKFEEAAEVCKQELQEDPQRVSAIIYLGWSLLRLHRPAEALEWANKGLSFIPNDERIIHISAEALYALGRYDEALIKCREYVKYGGGKLALIYYYMGMIYLSRKEYVNADIALSAAVYYYANDAGWWERLGFARENTNDSQAALEAYNEALKRNPNQPEALKGRDRVSKNQNQP
jgi:tetratricopeptide (TPR) repeat protein